MRTISVALLGMAMLFAGAMQPARAQAQSSAPASPPADQAAPAPATPPPAALAPALAAAPAPAAAASPSGAYYIVTYFNAEPKATRKAAALLRQFAAATRKEDGNTELTVLHELNRPGHFAIVEAWKDKAAADAHAAAMKALGDKLQPIVTAPFSARPFLELDVAKPAADANLQGAIWVVTHIDVFPQSKDEVAGMVKQLATDSRKDAGVQRFDALIWDGRANHFHLIEAWADRKSLEAHAAADHTRAFRAKLTPFEGAPYDERIYEVLKKSD
ncbi:MAG TPA: antibiotic biosynthesis monooxygenase [Stellaceae bacterium]|nr:antibiotic biosynthesis monooxygenase [Stellaceae bacterium]